MIPDISSGADFGFCNGELILWSDIDKDTVGPVFHKKGRAYRNCELLPNSRFGNPVQLQITVDWSLKPYPIEIAGQILSTGALGGPKADG